MSSQQNHNRKMVTIPASAIISCCILFLIIIVLVVPQFNKYATTQNLSTLGGLTSTAQMYTPDITTDISRLF